MSSVLYLDLDGSLAASLDEYCRLSGRSPDDVAREALRRYLAVRSFRRLREQILPCAEAQGYRTDEDVFRKVS
jgi:hypothetical protein